MYGLQDSLVLIDGSADEVQRLRSQVGELQQEVLRLRDEVIGRDAVLGSCEGRIVEMTIMIHRYESMRQRLEAILGSTSWRMVWAAGTPVRRLRGRRALT